MMGRDVWMTFEVWMLRSWCVSLCFQVLVAAVANLCPFFFVIWMVLP